MVVVKELMKAGYLVEMMVLMKAGQMATDLVWEMVVQSDKLKAVSKAEMWEIATVELQVDLQED